MLMYYPYFKVEKLKKRNYVGSFIVIKNIANLRFIAQIRTFETCPYSSAMRPGKGQRLPNDQVHELINGMITKQMKKTTFDSINEAGRSLGLTTKCKSSLVRSSKGISLYSFIMIAQNLGKFVDHNIIGRNKTYTFLLAKKWL